MLPYYMANFTARAYYERRNLYACKNNGRTYRRKDKYEPGKTPMHFFKEAKRRDDTVTMERSIGHAAKFAGKAKEYRAKAKKGMAEDAKEAREQAALARENAIKSRQAERNEAGKSGFARQTTGFSILG